MRRGTSGGERERNGSERSGRNSEMRRVWLKRDRSEERQGQFNKESWRKMAEKRLFERGIMIDGVEE